MEKWSQFYWKIQMIEHVGLILEEILEKGPNWFAERRLPEENQKNMDKKDFIFLCNGEHESLGSEDGLCYWCDGSGEGYAPDTSCRACSSVAEKEYEPED